MAEVKLNNAGVADNDFSTRKYVDAAGLQALIDKIGALRTSLKADDQATALAASQALTAAVETINQSITANSTADAERAEKITALETWKTDTVTPKITALETADSTEAQARAAEDTNLGNRIKAIEELDLTNGSNYVAKSVYDTKMAEIDGKLDDILEALNNAVATADVNAAFDSATADEPQA